MNYNQDDIRQLITEKLTDTISSDDERYLEECIRSDEQSALLWEQMQQKWKMLQGNSTLQQVNPFGELEIVKAEINRRRRSVPVTISRLCAAAAFIIIVGAGWMLMQKRDPVLPVHSKPVAVKTPKKIELVLGSGRTVNISGKPETIDVDNIKLTSSTGVLQYSGAFKKSEQYNTLNIPESLDYKIVLSDGTRVWLNSASSLKFPFAFSGKTREVYLDGEAYFEVAKNPAVPFLVHTPKTTIHVLGTSFNVNTYDSGVVKTSLVEGKIKTTSVSGDSLLLRAGYEADYDVSRLGFKTRAFDKQYVLSWMEGSYLFNNVALKDLSGTLERWFGIRVISGDDGIAGKTVVSGIIEKGKLKEFLENLQASTGIRYSLLDNTLRFYEK